MTLILTEISSWGIVMAADSALTQKVITPSGDLEYQVLTGVNKLQVINKLNAGIAVWGQGEIKLPYEIAHKRKISSDMWLKNFIQTKEPNYNTLDEFALLLQNELRKYIPKIDATVDKNGTIGFLLTGYVNYKGQPTPSFYHIHNGESSTLNSRRTPVKNPNIVNANHDFPPDIVQKFFAEGEAIITRNGDFVTYAALFEHIGTFLQDLHQFGGLTIPHSRNLKERAEWLRFQIRTMSELYRLSDLHLPTIGGKIDTLLITPEGVDDCGLTF
jgi:hypothetical protein